MARFLFGTLPIAGHVYPILSVARKLVERGHKVAWCAGKQFRQNVERTGARWLAMKQALDFDDQDIEAAFPERAKYHGLARLKFDLMHVFGTSIEGQFRDLEEILLSFPADVLVSDNGFFGAALCMKKERFCRDADALSANCTHTLTLEKHPMCTNYIRPRTRQAFIPPNPKELEST